MQSAKEKKVLYFQAVCGGARLVAGRPRLLQLPDRAAHEGLENEFYIFSFFG